MEVVASGQTAVLRVYSLNLLTLCAAVSFALCGAIAFPASVRAQTVLINPVAVTTRNFTYGDLSFAITSCNFTYVGGSVSCGSDGSEIEGVSTGRGGTGIELLATSGSYIQAAGSPNTTLNFTIKVSDLTGSQGISSISNILSASDKNALDNSLVSSVISGASIPTATSSIGSLISTSSFALTENPISFNVSIDLDTSGAKSGDTLTLNDVKLLFVPAPEPASIGLLLTGLGGLAACRRRSTRGARRPSDSNP